MSISSAIVSRSVLRNGPEGGSNFFDSVAKESYVAMIYNGISHAVMCASPSDLSDLALGFSLCEGIVKDPSELYDCDVADVSDTAVEVRMQISGERFANLKQHRRNLLGRSGCGLCGTESLASAMRAPASSQSIVQFSAATIESGLRQMSLQQSLQHATGGTHACGWLNASGGVEYVREDVGRHNALDKLLGALVAQKMDLSSGAVLTTSRASLEMVHKTATMGIGMLIAISAPTDTAIAMAEQSKVSLIAFARGSSLNVYCHAERLNSN